MFDLVEDGRQVLTQNPEHRQLQSAHKRDADHQ